MNSKIILGIILSFLAFTLTVVPIFHKAITSAYSGNEFAQAEIIDWWTAFRHDIFHTGHSTSTGPNTNNTIWNYTTGGYVYSSPAVVDGYVYVGSHDRSVYCLNATSERRIWNRTIGGFVQSSPTVVDGYVYVGSYDTHVYRLDAATGTVIRRFKTGGVVESSPAVTGGKIYVGSYDRNIYCFDAVSGKTLWNRTIGGIVESSPAVAGDYVYIGSWDRNIFCLNAIDGTPIWNRTTGGIVSSSPAVVGGKVYVGSYDHKIYCWDAPTGTPIWNRTTGNAVVSSPALADGKVYVGSLDYYVYCWDAATGAPIWNRTTGYMVQSSPAVAGDYLYIGSYDGKVHCFNATDGMPIWNYTTGGGVQSSPAVAGGRVYIGSHDTKVYAFGLPPPFDVTIKAHCNTCGQDVGVSIVKVDGLPTGYITPYTFPGLRWSHNFTVNGVDSNGHPFRQWNTGETNETITVSRGGSYTALYEEKVSLTIIANGNGTTNPLPDTHKYWEGTQVPVSATPDSLHEFVYWTLDGIIYTENPIMVNMNTSHYLVAVFSYDIIIKAHCNTTNEDISVSFTMDRDWSTPYTTPYIFTNLKGTHLFEVPDNDSHNHPFRLWSTGENHTAEEVSMGGIYTAYYRANWNLTITTTTGGNTSPWPAPITLSFDVEQNVTIWAMPDEGYGFDHWVLDGNVRKENPIIVLINMSHDLHAVFAYGYSVTIKAHCIVERADKTGISIIMDGNLSLTYITPHPFTTLAGTHTFTVPNTDPNGHKFKWWHTGQTNTTIAVNSTGTYVAYYGNETYPVHNVAVIDVMPCEITPYCGPFIPLKTIIGYGFNLTIIVTLANPGDYAETFYVSTSVGFEEIRLQTVTLPSGASTTLAIIWSPSPIEWAKGEYSVAAYAILPGDGDNSDNEKTDGTIQVTIAGDVNGDYWVNIQDATQLLMRWHPPITVPPVPANVDINGDGIINIKDATIIGRNWLKSP